jgi:hypothetical protein
MKGTLKVLLLLFFTHSISAQTESPINTDRPDQSDGTYILTKKSFQIEEGILYAKDIILNNFMLRYGVTKSTEVRLLVDAGEVDLETGLLPIGLSVKQRLCNQRNALPAITLIGYVRPGKLASKEFKTDETPYSVLLAFQNDLSDQISVGYNLGTTTFNNDLNATVSIGYSFFEKLSFFTEYFAHFESELQPSHNVDLGILYLVNNRFQLDIAAGTALINPENTQFATAGFSYRFGY